MTTRKNILILMHNTAIQFIDIANQYVKLFDPERYHVTVAYLSGAEDERTRNNTLGDEVLFLNCSKKDIRGIKIQPIKRLIALCKERQFAIVVCHRYKPIYIMLWVGQFCKIPRIFMVMHAMRTLTSTGRKLFLSVLMRRNMYLAGVSNAVRDDLRASTWCIPHERIITLYNSIDMQSAENRLYSRAEARNALGVPPDAFVFGHIGRLAPEKDQKNMLEAFALLKPHMPQAKFLLIGDGPLEQELKKLTVELNLQNDVIFTGFVAEAQRYLRAFDVFMLVSTKEAFGRVLLEAMIAKVPVVGSLTNGIPEVVGDAGKTVPASNPQALSAVLLELGQSAPAVLAEWGNKGYLRVKNHFSTEKFREDFWQLSC